MHEVISRGMMHSMKIRFKNLRKLVLKIEIDLGREPKILPKIYIFKKGFFFIMQYLCKYAFFEIFLIFQK